MSDYEIIQVLSQYEEYFQVYDLVSYLLRSLGWMLVKFLYAVLEGVAAGRCIHPDGAADLSSSQRLCPELLAGSLPPVCLFLFGNRI